METSETCPLCMKSLANGTEIVRLTSKGVKGIEKASEARERYDLVIATNTAVHVLCRQDFVHPKKILIDKKRKAEAIASSTPVFVKRRSQTPSFDYKNRCFLCGFEASLGCDTNNPNRNDLTYPVRTTSFQTLTYNTCIERNDDWGTAVLGRIEFACDLHASDAIYHQVCNVNFRTKKNIPIRYQKLDSENTTERHTGRPKDTDRERAFLTVVENLTTNPGDQKTISELVEEMTSIVQPAYTNKYFKKKLEEVLGDNIIISNVCGKHDVVTFNHTAAEILQDFYDVPRNEDSRAEEERIIKTSAALIRSKIIVQFMTHSKEFYPDPEDLKSLDTMTEFVPSLLALLLQELFVGTNKDLKIASLGQCLVQAARPRAILAPFNLGLAVQLHHTYGSKLLIDTLNAYGFCSSYSEVLHFELNAATQASMTADADSDNEVLESEMGPPNLTDHQQNDTLQVEIREESDPALEEVNVNPNGAENTQPEKPPILDKVDAKIDNAVMARQILQKSFGNFRQYVGDNADHNPWTLDGKKSLHVMGMIETITPEIKCKALIKRNTTASRRYHMYVC